MTMARRQPVYTESELKDIVAILESVIPASGLPVAEFARPDFAESFRVELKRSRSKNHSALFRRSHRGCGPTCTCRLRRDGRTEGAGEAAQGRTARARTENFDQGPCASAELRLWQFRLGADYSKVTILQIS